MPKLIAVLSAPSVVARGTFHLRLLDENGPLFSLSSPRPVRLVVDLVDVSPPAGSGDYSAPYDAVVGASFADTDDMVPWCIAVATALGEGASWGYRVAEKIQLDEQPMPRPGERTPGVDAVYLVRRRAELDDREAALRWREHAPLARRHHAGMNRYVQNGVIEAVTPGAPIIHGIAVLHFATRADLEQRLYDSAEGEARIKADAAGLVAEATALYCSEYRLIG